MAPSMDEWHARDRCCVRTHMNQIKDLKDSMAAKMDEHESNTKEAMAQANINATEMSKIRAEVSASNEQAMSSLVHRS